MQAGEAPVNGKATEKHRRPGPGNPSGQGKQCPRVCQPATSDPTTHILVLSPRQESSSSPAPVACHGDVSLSQASQGAQPPQPYLAQREVQAGAGYVSSVTSFRQLRGLSLEAGRAVLEELVLPAHGDDSCRWHLLERTL